MEGYIRLHRKFTEWEWYTDVNTKTVFLHLLLTANWKDGRFKGQEVPRGSVITSIGKLADNTGLTVNEVRTALDHLEKTGEIHKQTTNRFSLISVQNYNFYQDDSQADHNQNTSKAQPINNLLTTIEKGKKEKRKEIVLDSKESNCPKAISDEFKKAVQAWNELSDKGIRPVMKVSVSSKRGGMLNARIKQNGIDKVLFAIKKVGESDFLQGKVKPVPWFDFEWFVHPNNFQNVLEGKYDNRDTVTVNDDSANW